jgi:tetratricopeptide (TPR) repeat protein
MTGTGRARENLNSQQVTPPAPPVSPIEAEVLRIRELIGARRPAESLAAAQRLLRTVPENRDVLYMIAVSQRYLGQVAAALETLAHFETIHPRYSRLFQERGHCFLAARQPAAAIEAFLQAVHLNAALPGSWKALQILFQSAGRADEAALAAQHVAKLAELPTAVVTASSMFADGEIHEAERVIRQFLREQGNHVEAMRLLAQIGMKLDILDDAEFLLESLLVFDPDYHLARYDYVRVLLQRHRHRKALEECQILLRADPGNRDYRAAYASACVALSDYDEAIRVYRDLVAETPKAAEIHLSIAHALKTLGRQTEAIAAYRKAAQIRPSYGDAYWSLANLKIYRFTDDELERMRAEESRPEIDAADRYHLCFALGKALEDRADFAASFGFYERGNALKKAEINYRTDPIDRNVVLQRATFTPAFLAARRDVGCDRPDPIFIVGLPRAGSTLIEQILASHSEVEGTMELSDISRLVQHLQGRQHDERAPLYPGVLADLPTETLRAFGEKYLADTQVYRSGKPYFIDKNPNNFRHIGLIHLILPNAKIIDARREPMACCFSNFKQLFASGQEFTYGIGDIAHYYRRYVELMAFWDEVLPGKILRVRHEEVVEDLAGNVRRILDFCGLPFEEGCLEFHKTERSVRTASSEQVRRPIFSDGLEQWRNFEPWLSPLKQALAEQ